MKIKGKFIRIVLSILVVLFTFNELTIAAAESSITDPVITDEMSRLLNYYLDSIISLEDMAEDKVSYRILSLYITCGFSSPYVSYEICLDVNYDENYSIMDRYFFQDKIDNYPFYIRFYYRDNDYNKLGEIEVELKRNETDEVGKAEYYAALATLSTSVMLAGLDEKDIEEAGQFIWDFWNSDNNDELHIWKGENGGSMRLLNFKKTQEKLRIMVKPEAEYLENE